MSTLVETASVSSVLRENERLREENGYLLAVLAQARIERAWAQEVADRAGQVGPRDLELLAWDERAV